MPFLHDLEFLAAGDSLKATVLFGDLYKLRQIKASEVLDLLGQVQQSVSEDLSKAQQNSEEARNELAKARAGNNQDLITAAQERDNNTTANLTAVKGVDIGLKEIAKTISSLRTALDAAFAPLLGRLQQVEVWYDTIMQGFEERYTRHMKTVGIAISIVVVVVLNANFFSIYRAIKSDRAKTAVIIQQGPAILKIAEQEKAPKQIEAATPNPTPSTSAATTPSNPATTTESGDKPKGTSETKEKPTSIEDVKKDLKEVESLFSTFESFGIRPLARQQIYDAFTPGKYRLRDLNETFVGWALMVILLSAGAPFWQDALESLFGLKNVLRQKSGTKNVEEEKGGQPKP
jgi:hypothetical protein